MSKTHVPKQPALKPTRRGSFAAKAGLWVLLTILFWFAVAGGPAHWTFLYILVALSAGWLISQDADEGEKKAVAVTMLAFMIVTALWIVSPQPGYKAMDLTSQVGYWWGYKVLFVVGLAQFGSALIEPMKKGNKQTAAIIVGFALPLWPFLNVAHEHAHEKRVQCAEINKTTDNKVMCTPVHDDTLPWYTPDMVQEDVALGLMAVLVIAAMKASEGSSEDEPSKETKKQTHAKNRK